MPGVTDAVIHAQGLSRHYNVGKIDVPALDGISLQVNQGEFVALVGPSGSGKSTLLNLVGGLDRPSSGALQVAGLDLMAATERQLVRYRREKIGIIFQSFNLLAARTAVENVETPLTLTEVPRRTRRQRALDLLTSVGLEKRAHHRPNELSGGEMQRVAVARSLANQPSLLLADEPTGNLDTRTGQEILELLRATVRDRGVTLLLVTHDLEVAAHADRIVQMRDGQIQRVQTQQEFVAGRLA